MREESDWAHCHVALTTNIGLCERFVEFAGNAEIAELDLTLSIEEDIGRFYI
jgi:hypothetical protein